MKWRIGYKLLLLIGLSVTLPGASGGGCGGENLFEGIADDDSRQAKIEAAQLALDKGECQAAIDGFEEVHNLDTSNVDVRQDLSAAYMCRAGFNVASFIKIAADFQANSVQSGALFKTISDQAVNLVDSSWQDDTSTAEGLLSPYQSDSDVAFSLAVISTVKATLTVLDLINYANGLVGCFPSNPCTITSSDAETILNNLDSAYISLSNAGLVNSDIAKTVDQVRSDIKNIDSDPNDTVTSQDVVDYLNRQGFDTTNIIAG